MTNANVIAGTVVSTTHNAEIDKTAGNVVTNAHYAIRSADRHQEGVTEASQALSLAESSLKTIISARTGKLDDTTTYILEESVIVKADLTLMDSIVSAATTGLAEAQTAEHEALKAETGCKDSVMDTAVKPLQKASDELSSRLDHGDTGDFEDRVRQEYLRLGRLLGIEDADTTDASETIDLPDSITDQLIALDKATDELIKATNDRRSKEKVLKIQRDGENAMVEATTPVLQEMSDHERVMNHLASLINKLSIIADIDQPTYHKIKAILVTLWLVLSEPRSKAEPNVAFVKYKETVSDIELGTKSCVEIEQ